MVEKTAQLPEPVAIVPTRFTTDTRNRPPDFLGGGRQENLPRIVVKGASGPARVAGSAPLGGRDLAGIDPGAFYLTLADPLQGQAYRQSAVDQFLRDKCADAGVPADYLVAQAFCQGAGQDSRHRCQQVNPGGTQPRGQDGNRDNQALRQAGLLGKN